MMSKVAVVISSFDGFADCWHPLEYSFSRFWKDCPWPVYLITNKQNYTSTIFKVISVGEDRGWASNLKCALAMVDTEYILYIQEDYWINKLVNNRRLLDVLELMDNQGWFYFRLYPRPLLKNEVGGWDNISVSPVKHKYRVSLQASFWKTSFLSTLLVDGETGWDFEKKSTERISHISEGCFAVCSVPILSYVEGTAIRKGKWTRPAIEFIKLHNLPVNTSMRQVEGRLIDFLAMPENLLRFPFRFIIRILNLLKLNI